MNLLSVIAILCFIYSNVSGENLKIGAFTNYHHGIGGTVYVVDEKTILIKGFKLETYLACPRNSDLLGT